MYTIPELTARCNALPRTWYGQFGDRDGFWIIADNTLFWRDEDGTQVEVDLNEFRAHGIRLGQVDIAEAQAEMDGDRVKRCSRTVATGRAA